MVEEFAGGGVDDSDIEVGDEHRDVGSGVRSADADVQAASVERGHRAGLVDAVVAESLMVALAGPVLGGGRL